MPRKRVLRKDDVYRCRAGSWEFHYKNRKLARDLTVVLNVEKILTVIDKHVPESEVQIDGDLLFSAVLSRERGKALEELGLGWKYKDLMCRWYWTEEDWMDYVRQFQSLPDVMEDYYYKVDFEFDGLRLVPVTSCRRGRPVDKCLKPVDKHRLPVDNSVEKAGTAGVCKVHPLVVVNVESEN